MASKKALKITSVPTPRPARHGERMIEVRLRFFTDDIAGKKGEIVPKHAWARGMASIERNVVHGITPTDPIPFNSASEIPFTVEKVLLAHGIKLVVSPKMKKYMLNDAPKEVDA